MDSLPIIVTKLQPPLARNVFPRQRLTDLIRQCAERRLTLVCAGAGYGKTTLIASEFRNSGLPIIWYSLNRSDRDLVTFCSYLLEALDRQWRGLAEDVRPTFTLNPNVHSFLTSFAAACANQMLARAGEDFLIVFDDFQLVDHVPEICAAVDQLINYAPPSAHFVVTSRAAPLFPSLTRWRARGDAAEIGEAELRFKPDEASALFTQCLNLRLPDSRVATLVEQTEGWVLGLLLAGQSIKGGGNADVEDRVPATPANRRILFEYLTEEILRQQSPMLDDFLISSSILSRLEPTECDAILGRSDSELRLHEIEQNHLFVTRTGDGQLRYHRLFREFLLQHLADDPQRCETMHRRAAAYFEPRGDSESAVFHWLEAGAYREAAMLIAAASAEWLQGMRYDTLLFCLSRLPETTLKEFPELLFRWGQVFEAKGQWDHALEYYERAAQTYTARGDLLSLSDVLRSKGHILDWRKGRHVEAERLHREALRYVGEEHRRKRAALLASLARDQLSAGQTAAAQELYRESLTIYEVEADRLGQLETLLNPGAWLYHSLGDFLQALAVLRRAEMLAIELNSSRHLAEAYNDMAVNLYFLGRHSEAMACAEKALTISVALQDAHGEAYALMNQANSLEATCGMNYAELYQQYQRALHIEQALGHRRFKIATLVFMSVLARRGGNMSEAVRRAQQALELANERGLRWLAGFVLAQLGAAQIWIDPTAARLSLDESLALFEECQDLYHLTVTRFWLAALDQTEQNPAYLDHLRECLRLAVSRNYDHFFRSEAQAAIPLLTAAVEHDIRSSYIAPILISFGARAVDSLRPLLTHADTGARTRARQLLEEMKADLTETATPSKRSRKSILTIRCFGHFTVLRGSEEIQEREWGRRTSKRLMKFVALSPSHAISKDEVIDLLGGEVDSQAANANFYRALYNLRRVLEPLAPHSAANYVVFEGGLLRLANGDVARVDMDEFTRKVEEGRRLARSGDKEGARSKLAAATTLYVDDLSTDDLYDDWVRSRRDQLRGLYLTALRELADLSLEAGEMDVALHALRQAFHKDQTSEETCLSLMSSLMKSGLRAEALQCYALCERALAEIDLEPSAGLRQAQQAVIG
jgi:ATP/maltotriose-dependent transcriptional regulator MalT